MSPTPDIPPNEVGFLLKFWQEILAGAILLLSGLLLRAKGKKEPVYLAEEDIEQRMTICKQSILLALNEMLDERDEKLLNQIEKMIK